MIRYLTAGESHGPALMGIVEGLPANLSIDLEQVNHELHRRQQGFGRGGRMRIERDAIEVVSGLRFGKTLGSPIGFILRNKDWPNWLQEMSHSGKTSGTKISRPRPGHADLSGFLKYHFSDMRNVLERSSARETAMRVAAGAFVKQLLHLLGIKIFSHVLQIGRIKASPETVAPALRSDNINELADASAVRCLDKKAESDMLEHIRQAKKEGDTLGGIIQIIIRHLPPGLGSYVHWEHKLDARLAAALMSIQAIKGVEIGGGFHLAGQRGSRAHDEMFYDSQKNLYRNSNHAGGIEGGMSNGEDIVIQIAKKPIPTLMKALRSVDVNSKDAYLAHKERSDVTAVPAASVIAEAVVAPVIANALLEKFGADDVDDIKQAYDLYRQRIANVIGEKDE